MQKTQCKRLKENRRLFARDRTPKNAERRAVSLIKIVQLSQSPLVGPDFYVSRALTHDPDDRPSFR